MSIDWQREELLTAARRLDELGLNRGTSGNSSVRTNEGLLITPSGMPTHEMVAEDLVELSMDGTATGATAPSSEWRIHRDIYARRPETRAVVHTHSTHATAMACLRRDVPPFHYMVAKAGGSSIRCAGYALYGTDDLSREALRALVDREACLLANHGMVALGPSLAQAIALAVEVEELCRQYLVASPAGPCVLLNGDEMDAALAAFATYGRPRSSR